MHPHLATSFSFALSHLEQVCLGVHQLLAAVSKVRNAELVPNSLTKQEVGKRSGSKWSATTTACTCYHRVSTCHSTVSWVRKTASSFCTDFLGLARQRAVTNLDSLYTGDASLDNRTTAVHRILVAFRHEYLKSFCTKEIKPWLRRPSLHKAFAQASRLGGYKCGTSRIATNVPW
jgi:hypothetical protein